MKIKSRLLLVWLSSAASAALTVFAAACSGDDDKAEELPIPLPPRPDGSSSGDPDGSKPACDVETDPRNCGRCGNVCPDGPRGKAACSRGTCVLACDEGFGDCNGSPTDGCETDLTTKVDNCGACNRDCRSCGGMTATCNAGICGTTTLSSGGQNEITHLTNDETRIVYADTAGVSQMNKADGGGVAGIYGVTNTPGILVKGNVLFIYPGTESFSGIYSTYAGFVGPQIAAFARGENAQAMAIDDTGLYYAVETAGGNRASKVLRCKDCNVPTELSPTENSLRPGSIALDETTVFFGAGDLIRRVEKTGANLKTLAIGQSARSLVVDSEYVYWINEPPFVFPGQDAGGPRGEVARIRKDGSNAEVEKIAVGLTRPLVLSVSGDFLYVLDRGTGTNDGTLFRLEKDGKSRVALAKNLSASSALTVDNMCAFFGSSGSIRRITR